MTIDKVYSDGTVNCVWVFEGKIESYVFHSESLKIEDKKV